MASGSPQRYGNPQFASEISRVGGVVDVEFHIPLLALNFQAHANARQNKCG